jgi:hypothetical protein
VADDRHSCRTGTLAHSGTHEGGQGGGDVAGRGGGNGAKTKIDPATSQTRPQADRGGGKPRAGGKAAERGTINAVSMSVEGVGLIEGCDSLDLFYFMGCNENIK